MARNLELAIDDDLDDALYQLVAYGYGQNRAEVAIYLLRREIDDLKRELLLTRDVSRKTK